jgi:hypothetical protein
MYVISVLGCAVLLESVRSGEKSCCAQRRSHGPQRRFGFEGELSRDKLKSALRDNPEFRVFARYWSGSLRFDVGDDVYLIKIKDGEVNAVDAHAPATAGSGDVVITAPAEDWAHFLQPFPEPWYHEFYPASAHHGFRLGGDPDTLWPYYYAIRRSGEILRSLATVEKV